MTATAWTYRGLDADGATVAGEINAASELEAVASVRGLGYRPTAVAVKRTGLLQRQFDFDVFAPKVKVTELAAAIRQMSAMLRAGVPMMRSFAVLVDQTSNRVLRAAWVGVRDDVEAGEPLSIALRRRPRVFDRLLVNLAHAGEASGQLDEVLDQAALALERRAELRRKLRSALSYPIAVLVLVALVIVAMSVFVVPVFRTVYADLGGELPVPTKLVLAVTGFIGHQAPLLAVGAVGAAAMIRRWKATERGAAAIDRALFRMPLAGDLIRRTALARTARTLAVLVQAGVPLLESLDIAAAVSNNAVIRDVLVRANEAVRSGRTLSSELVDAEEIPALFAQVIAVGEESGDIAEMLGVVADIYESEVDQAAATFSSVVEPALIGFLGVVVGGLVLSLYLPMFRLVDLVQ